MSMGRTLAAKTLSWKGHLQQCARRAARRDAWASTAAAPLVAACAARRPAIGEIRRRHARRSIARVAGLLISARHERGGAAASLADAARCRPSNIISACGSACCRWHRSHLSCRHRATSIINALKAAMSARTKLPIKPQTPTRPCVKIIRKEAYLKAPA